MSLSRLFGAIAGLALLAAGALPARADDVTVFAAASLTNALNEIAESFTAKTGHKVIPSYAASSALAKQVEQGAPANVFASADTKWVDYLDKKGLLAPGSRVDLLGNTLVLVAPADTKLTPIALSASTDIAALAGDGRIATGNPDSVPVGLYFKQAMENAGQWAAVEPKVARADSVRAALALVERGEATLGVVYGTDAAITKKVKILGTFPASLNDPIVYPFALIAGQDTPAARAFLDAVKAPEAKAVFAKYGFKVD